MKRYYFNSLDFIIFMIILSFSIILPVYWLNTTKEIPSQVTYSNNDQQNLKQRINILDSEIKNEMGDLLQEKVENRERIARKNPAFGKELPYSYYHIKPITTIAFSPDGSILASGSEDNLIKLWDITLGVEILSFNRHISPIRMISFSPDGSIVASAGQDGTINIWKTATGEVLQNWTHIYNLYSLAFSPNGKFLVSGDLTGHITIWNTTNWKEVRELTEKVNEGSFFAGSVNYIDFSSNGKLMAACGMPSSIKIWNTTDWEPIFDSQEHSNTVNEVKFSPNGKMLASACVDSKFWLWDLSVGEKTVEYDKHEDTYEGPLFGFHYSSIDFSPLGYLVASGGEDKSIRLWDTKKNTLQILSGHEDFVSRVIFSPDGTLLASSSQDKTIRLWNVARGANNRTLTSHEAAITSVAYSPNSEYLASGSEDNTIRLWNLTSGDQQTLGNHEKRVTSIVFAPNSSLLASASWDSNIILWNLTTRSDEFMITDPTGNINSLAFSSDGTMLASGGATSGGAPEIRIWNVTNGLELGSLEMTEGHSSPVTCLAFSSDNRFLVSGSEDGSLIIWDTTSSWSRIETRINWFEDNVNSIVFSPQENLLVTCGNDNFIKVKNMTNGEEQSIPTGHSGSILNLNFSPDGKLLVSGGADGTFRTWNISNWEEVQLFFLGHKINVKTLCFSLDGEIIVSGGSDSAIILWNVNTIADSDEDGMPDSWELDRYPALDPADYWDKFHDEDEDHLMNCLEYFLEIDPLDVDSDNDSMPDGWEYLGGFDPKVNDTDRDNDEDDIPGLYEYQMGLNPWINDAEGDLDNDTLTNLDEYYFGSWANQSDSDLDEMDDWWEFKYTDSTYSFNPRNGSDTLDDPDGDWISNLVECRAGSNPRDFWDVPLLAPSVLFFIRLLILLIVVVLGVVTFFIYRKNQRNNFTASLNAPDYKTALVVKKAGYTDHPAFVKAVLEAENLAEKGMKSYYQGDPVAAIQRLEQSLTIFERVGNEPLIGRTIFQVALIQKERQELTSDSSILKIFPKEPFSQLTIEAINHMLRALIAENERNWGLANSAWQAALGYEELDIDLHVICQGALVESEVRSWLEHPIEATLTHLEAQLDEWQKACMTHQLFPGLCQASLLRARISFASAQFDNVTKWLDNCSKVAEKNNLLIYQEAARREKFILLRHKKQIEEEITKPISPEEQEKVMQEYIKQALESLKKERLI
ncbi:MAG: hypothetical protein ACFFB2_13330 [Promethearchaeota archaeon]